MVGACLYDALNMYWENIDMRSLDVTAVENTCTDKDTDGLMLEVRPQSSWGQPAEAENVLLLLLSCCIRKER